MVAAAPPTGDSAKRERFYDPQGYVRGRRTAARYMLACRAPEILIEGPAGTGKSRAVLEKILMCCEFYAGIRVLIVRKTRNSLSESVLVTWEEHVVPAGHPCLDERARSHRTTYDFPNGATVVLGGMDKWSRLMSTEFDMVCAFEATELAEDDWEALTTRCRNGVMPFQQCIADCNPVQPSHWLNKRAARGDMLRLPSRHEDNPRYWGQDGWTPAAKDYIGKKLNKLTGHRRARLLEGRWVAAEGIVYPEYDPAVHLIYHKDLPAGLWYFASVDWGYTNAGVINVWGVDGDGRLYRTAEIYRTQRSIGWWKQRAKELRAEFGIVRFACDPAEPGNIAEFRKANLPAYGAENDIVNGISLVRDRLMAAGDGRPRLFFCRDAQRYRDEALDEKHEPASTVEEFDSYVYPDAKEDRNDDEKPVDQYNHGMDTVRYAAWHAERYGKGLVSEVITNTKDDDRASPRVEGGPVHAFLRDQLEDDGDGFA